MKKILYLLLLLLPVVIQAQSGPGSDKFKLPKIPRQYHTQQNHQRLLSLDRDMVRRRNFYEFSAIHSGLSDLPKEVSIPVVVHILYKTGADTKTLPSVNDVKQQLNISSGDFRQKVKIEKHEADTKEKFSDKNALDTRISFCLAATDPSGRNTNGVMLVPTTTTTWLADDKMKSATTGGSTAWDTEKYLNIWVVNFPDNISGYAQMPGGPSATDGIVIDAKYFGKKSVQTDSFPYTEGKTLTHMLGSYLNLYELWSDTELCGDDAVEDTPIHNAPNIGCPTYRHVTTCEGNAVEMTMNFMDNTNDACQYMFTNGQKRRMIQGLIEGGMRYKLVQSGEVQCINTTNLQALQERDNKSIDNTPTAFNYRIYPNPANDNLNLEVATEKTTLAALTVFNIQGQVQKQINYTISEGSQVFSINCANWPTGMYFVRLAVNNEVKNEKILINR